MRKKKNPRDSLTEIEEHAYMTSLARKYCASGQSMSKGECIGSYIESILSVFPVLRICSRNCGYYPKDSNTEYCEEQLLKPLTLEASINKLG